MEVINKVFTWGTTLYDNTTFEPHSSYLGVWVTILGPLTWMVLKWRDVQSMLKYPKVWRSHGGIHQLQTTSGDIPHALANHVLGEYVGLVGFNIPGCCILISVMYLKFSSIWTLEKTPRDNERQQKTTYYNYNYNYNYNNNNNSNNGVFMDIDIDKDIFFWVLL